jgi:hypothetical protein
MNQAHPFQPDEATTTLALLNQYLAAIVRGEEPFGPLVLGGPPPAAPPHSGSPEKGANEEGSIWPRIPGPGKSAMNELEVEAFFARLVGKESLYHTVEPKGVRYRKLTVLLGDKYSMHAALISVWLDRAGLLMAAADQTRPWATARLLTTEDLSVIAAKLSATALPTSDQVEKERARGLR